MCLKYCIVTLVFTIYLFCCDICGLVCADNLTKTDSQTITIGVGRDFYDGSDSRSFLHGSTNSWEGLAYLNENLKAVPCIAESWTGSDDGKKWTFYIREGVHFHDGTLLTNKDVVFAVNRIISNPKYDIAGNYRSVLSVNAEGEREVVFILKEPIPYFPNLTAYYSSPIIKPDSIKPDGTIANLNATGPYKVSKIVNGERIELEPHGKYWGKKPLYSKVVFRTIIDTQSRLMALASGEIDAVADVGGILPEQSISIKSYPDLILKRVEVATTHLIIFNCNKPPFQMVKNRLWFSGELNRKNLIDAFAKGAGIEAGDPYTQLAKDFVFGLIKPSKTPFSPFDNIEKPVEILLGSSTLQRWPYSEIAQVMQQMLQSKGIASEIKIKELGAYHDSVKQGKFDIAIQPYTLMSGDPDFFYSYWIESDAPRNCGWKKSEADALIESARYEMNVEKRKDKYRKLEQMINDNLPILPIYHDISLYACSKRFEKFEMDHLFKPILVEK